MRKNGILAKGDELSLSFEATNGAITIGIDLGDRFSHCCLLGPGSEILTEGRVRTTPEGLSRHFQQIPPSRIAIEAGTHSGWISHLLSEWGHEVIVANPRNVRLITHSTRKSDKVDAQMLARLARVDPTLLSPIAPRSRESYPDVAQLRARDLLVKSRTKLINAVRGLMKAAGLSSPSCGISTFARRVAEILPDEMKPSLMPLLETIAHLTRQICAFDMAIERLATERYPETKRLRQVSGVGAITSLQFVLAIGDPNRFSQSRAVAAYLGLTPRKYQSGEVDPQLRITKAGDRRLRSLLVQCAHYLLGRFGPDTDLKRWGVKLAARGGKNAKNRAIIAVARKLAVLLHRLWVTGDTYHPLQNATRAVAQGC